MSKQDYSGPANRAYSRTGWHGAVEMNTGFGGQMRRTAKHLTDTEAVEREATRKRHIQLANRRKAPITLPEIKL